MLDEQQHNSVSDQPDTGPRAWNGESFAGRTVFLTGAALSMGLTMAERFAAAGATVVITDLTPGHGEEAVASIAAQGGRALFYPMDGATARPSSPPWPRRQSAAVASMR